MAEEAKKYVLSKRTIQTKNGPMNKISLELNNVGTVMEKGGKFYLEIDPAVTKNFKTFEKDGNKRYFLNFNENTYTSYRPDEYQGGGSGDSQEDDGMPF